MNFTIKLRGDTEANWTSTNPVLAEREVALSTDKKRLKVGDGSTQWGSLPYFEGFIDGGLEIKWDGTGNLINLKNAAGADVFLVSGTGVPHKKQVSGSLAQSSSLVETVTLDSQSIYLLTAYMSAANTEVVGAWIVAAALQSVATAWLELLNKSYSLGSMGLSLYTGSTQWGYAPNTVFRVNLTFTTGGHGATAATWKYNLLRLL